MMSKTNNKAKETDIRGAVGKQDGKIYSSRPFHRIQNKKNVEKETTHQPPNWDYSLYRQLKPPDKKEHLHLAQSKKSNIQSYKKGTVRAAITCNTYF